MYNLSRIDDTREAKLAEIASTKEPVVNGHHEAPLTNGVDS
jgi:hypothetical protein